MTDFEWLVGQLRKILAWGETAASVSPEEFHDYGVHTALKLAALNHALDVFTPIARKKADEGRKYGRSVYVDLFAGCGVTRTPDGDWLAGSPIIAANSKAPFDALVLVEKGSRRLSVLKERMRRASGRGCPPPVFLHGDCNGLTREVLSHLKPDDLVFVCIDPEGMEIRWSTIRDIVSACSSSDLFINFTSGVERVRATAATTGAGAATLAEFTGRGLAETLARTGNGAAVLHLYEENLESELSKPFGAASQVASTDGNPRYHILIRTRRTSRGSPYWAAYAALEKRLKGVDAAKANQAIAIVKGRQSTL